VVEDVPEVAQVVAAMLERAGAEVACCEDPRDALEAVREDPEAWSLLVTDHDMRAMSGADLAAEVAGAAPELPVLLCTALGPEQRRDRAASALFDAVIRKPVAPERLIGAARAAILRREGAGFRE
jgi:CheY-like chemotaxis protein